MKEKSAEINSINDDSVACSGRRLDNSHCIHFERYDSATGQWKHKNAKEEIFLIGAVKHFPSGFSSRHHSD